jgi:hypothetical protein
MPGGMDQVAGSSSCLAESSYLNGSLLGLIFTNTLKAGYSIGVGLIAAAANEMLAE